MQRNLKNGVKREKSEKKRKNRLDFRFALFRFEAKITQMKRSEKLLILQF
jgi:hypothetical protein